MNNKIKVKKLFLLILFVQFIAVTFAQMSDDQVVAIVKEAQNQGKTQQQIIMMLGQKGVTQEQLIRIKNNYTGKKSTAGEQTGNGMSRLRQENPPAVNILDSLNLEEDKELLFSKDSLPEIRIFGRNIFNNKQLTFEPNLNIATPENYVLGPGDEIIVDIWGGSVKTIRQYIAPDGNIMSVFSRAFLIQYSPLISFIMCSYRKCCTSVKASPVSAQNTNMSLTVCRRGMVNSFFRSMFNSSSVRNARFVFVCLK